MNVSTFKNDGGKHGTLHCPPAEKLKVKLLDLEHSEMHSCANIASRKEDLNKGKMPTLWLNDRDRTSSDTCLKKEC